MTSAAARGPATQHTSGQNYTFRWRVTAAHSTTDFAYYITKPGWNQNAPLTRSALELTPFLRVPMNGARRWAAPAARIAWVVWPASDISHTGRVPNRAGRHMILAVWTIADTANAFYQCSDVRF